jgi:hypothetical protein
MVLDHTAATGFNPMRREANGGYRQTLDFPITPLRKWLEAGWELYSYTDPAPSGFTPATYIARGEVSGLESANSPLTNESVIRPDAIGDIEYTGICLPCDSLFTLRWRPVQGAARYWLHVYQLMPGATDDDNMRSGAPAPVNTVKPKDFLVAYTAPSDTFFKVGDEPHAGSEVFIDRIRRFSAGRTPVYNLLLNVRVSAVDARGQLIAYTHGDYGKIDAGDNYFLYHLGSVIVQPRNPRDFPPGQSGGCQREPSP